MVPTFLSVIKMNDKPVGRRTVKKGSKKNKTVVRGETPRYRNG
ncbi:hypothetical protein EVA_07064 [gut metagenome]|uniref:Uncharacterized protein n=1 Tax=gut metagenome TaxID=749906 RepID=J9GW41_9ZZZZ